MGQQVGRGTECYMCSRRRLAPFVLCCGAGGEAAGQVRLLDDSGEVTHATYMGTGAPAFGVLCVCRDEVVMKP